jgi:hypothetical protein
MRELSEQARQNKERKEVILALAKETLKGSRLSQEKKNEALNIIELELNERISAGEKLPPVLLMYDKNAPSQTRKTVGSDAIILEPFEIRRVQDRER